MSRWSDAEAWVGDGLRREVFFFESGEIDLYGSVYAASLPAAVGVVFCNSWGLEGDQGSRLVHPVALSFAEAGGVAVIFDYPGFGDSHGDLSEATMGLFAEAAVDAVHEASRRNPGTRWILAGLMLGASVACLAADRGAKVEDLLLIQPALRPKRYFTRLQRVARLSSGSSVSDEGFALGYPLPRSMLASAATADAAVDTAITRFPGRGTIVRHAEPDTIEGAPARFEHVCAPGPWRFGSQDHNYRDPALVRSTAQWLSQRVAAMAPGR